MVATSLLLLCGPSDTTSKVKRSPMIGGPDVSSCVVGCVHGWLRWARLQTGCQARGGGRGEGSLTIRGLGPGILVLITPFQKQTLGTDMSCPARYSVRGAASCRLEDAGW